MTRLVRVEHAEERMDRPDVDPADLAGALDHVATVNRWLGGRRALLRHLTWALDNPRGHPARIIDVGTGSADLPSAISRWARDRRRSVEVTGVDRHDLTLQVAARRVREDPAIQVVRGNGLSLPFASGTFDVALLSMTLHHMDGPALHGILAETARVARGGRILVGELERCIPGYVGARLLAASVWRRNPVTRHDGPLSVLRAFTPGELLDLADRAGLREPRVHRHPFYRLILRAHA